MENVFESTSRERIMKSLKLELKPHPNTRKAMKEHKVMEVNNSYTNAEKALHPAIDFVVKKIIAGSLATCHVDFTKLYALKLEAMESDTAAKKYTEAREKVLNEVTKSIAAYKLDGLKSYRDIGSADFLKKGLPNLIKNATSEEISTEEKIEWLETLQGFQGGSTLLLKFVTTRLSTLETWCPRRVLENFDIFIENMEKVRPFLATEYAKEFLVDFPECMSFTDPSYYEICMTPEGIEAYNHVLSGVQTKDGTEIKGYNQFVNEINQKNRAKGSRDMTFRILRPLNQQILFPKQRTFTIEQMTCEDDVRQALKILMENIGKKELFEIISVISRTSANEIVINGSELHNLSHIIFGKHNVIPDVIAEQLGRELEDELENTQTILENADLDKRTKVKELRDELKAYKQQHKSGQTAEELDDVTKSIDEKIKKINDNFKITKKELNQSLKDLRTKLERITLTISSKTFTFHEITEYCASNEESAKDILETYISHLKECYNNISVNMANIMDSNILTDGEIRFFVDNKKRVKDYLDSLIAFRSMVKIIFRSKEDERKNVLFYNELEEAYNIFVPLTKAYNQIRNFLTSKAGDFAQIETVFFGTPSKLTSRWWSGDRFLGNTETIIKMHGKYYYATRGLKQPSIDFELAEPNEKYVEVLCQKTSQDASKQIPRCIFSPECRDFFKNNPKEMKYVHTQWRAPLEVTREQYYIYNEKLYTVSALKSGSVSPHDFRKNLNNMINLYKKFCKCYDHYERFTFIFRPTEEYADMGEFVSEANVYMLNARWVKVKASQMDALISSGQLYAFLIRNQTMYAKSPYKDPYAMLFLHLMSHKNMKTGNCRLNARPSITFRPACIPKNITHAAGSVLVNKRTRSGETIPSDIYLQIYNYLNGKIDDIHKLSKAARKLLETGEVVSKIAERNLIKNKRYTEDKYFISISYVQNNRTSERASLKNTITEDVNKSISKNGVRTLAITRGVKHLLYYILFDKDRTILEEGSLNKINGVDYGKRLAELTVARNSGKSDDWNYTLTSKNVKEFYLHVAIGEICRIAYENQAIICIENLTPGFKDKMSALDNQIFGKFEIMLEERLRDLKFPKVKKGEPGSVTNPLQLTKTTLGKPMQNGILFKVNPAYTASICPETGFTNLFNFSEMQNVTAQKEFLHSFDSILYNRETNLFELTFDYSNFKHLSLKPEKKKQWKIFIGKDVYMFTDNKRTSVSEKLAELVQRLTKEDLIDKDLSKENIPASLRKLLFALIKNTLCRPVVRLEEGEESYFCSPAVEEVQRLTQSHVKTLNLAKRLWFNMDHMEDGKFQYVTSEEWTNHYLD